MGGGKQINPITGRRDTQFESLATDVELNLKIIRPKPGTNNKIGKTPSHSNTSKYYAVLDENGKVIQVAEYDETSHIKVKDIELGHRHENKYDKRIWEDSDIHVQTYREDLKRIREARDPTPNERYIFYRAKELAKGIKNETFRP